jgi:putative transposase
MSGPETLSEQERQQAWHRYEQIRPCLDAGVPATAVAQQASVSARTIERWVARYRRDGLAGLVRAPRVDRGQRRFPGDLIGLIEGLALRKPPPTAAAVYRQVVTVAEREGWPPPSYSTVYAVIRQINPALVTLAHEGTKAYRLAFDLLHRREATGPNDLWQADHTPLDLWVRDEHGLPVRPWLTVIIDDYSRAAAAYRLSLFVPTALNTALALRDAIGRKSDPRWHVCGIPATFYTDHGSDFTSRHIEQVALDLKMVLVFSEPGMPRGRGRIERFFQTINQLFLCTLPGYAPNGAPPGASLLTLPELDTRLRDFLLDDYHQRIHSETRMVPQTRWEAGGFLPHLPESAEQLDLLLLTVSKARKVQQDGIHFQGMRYLDLTLAAYIGEAVTIRYDPQDMAEIRVYHDGRFLCRAVCQELAGETISLKELIRTRDARRRELRETLSDRAALLDQLLAVPQPAPSADRSERTTSSPPQTTRLKRYINE